MSKKILTCLICFTLMLTWFYLAIFQDRIVLFEQKRKNIFLQKQLFAVYKSKADSLQGFLDQKQAKSDKFLISAKALPGKGHLSMFVDDVSRVVKKAGVKLLSLREGVEKDNDFYKEIPWTMEVLGSYKELVDFLFHIASMDRIVTIRTISLQRDKKKSMIHMDCTAVTYREL